MSQKSTGFMNELEEETRREGAEAVGEAEAFKASLRLAAELILRCSSAARSAGRASGRCPSSARRRSRSSPTRSTTLRDVKVGCDSHLGIGRIRWTGWTADRERPAHDLAAEKQ
jgi:hypothetical protein